MNEVSRKNEDKENIKLNNKKSVSLVKDSISLKKNPVPSSPKLNKHLNLREYSIEIKRFLKEEYVHIYVGNSGVELYIRIGQNRSRV